MGMTSLVPRTSCMCKKEGLEGLGARLRHDRVWLSVTKVWCQNIAEYGRVQPTMAECALVWQSMV